jgi:hypothetical protein
VPVLAGPGRLTRRFLELGPTTVLGRGIFF